MLAALLGVCLLYAAQPALAIARPPSGLAAGWTAGWPAGTKRGLKAGAGVRLDLAPAEVTLSPDGQRESPAPAMEAVWEMTPTVPFAGQVVTVTLTLRMNAAWARESLVQLFQQELSLPVQVEAFALAPEGLAWLPGSGFDGQTDAARTVRSAAEPTTLVLDGEVIDATSDVVEASDAGDPNAGPRAGPLRLVSIVRQARVRRPGRGKLLPPTVRLTAASSFREDFVQGRVPVSPERQEFRGLPLEFEIRRLPEAGRPLTFDGAIGSFELTASTPSKSPRVGEPFDFVVLVVGSSVLSPDVEPRLHLGSVFTQLGLEREDRPDGTSFRYSLAAHRAGSEPSPTARMDVFDPGTATYARTSSEPVALYLRPAAAPQSPGSESERPGGNGQARSAEDDGVGIANGPNEGPGDLTWTLAVLGLVGVLAVVSAVRRIAYRSGLRAIARSKPQVLMIGKYPLDAAAGDVVSVRRLTDHLRSAGFAVRYSEVTAKGELGSYPAEVPALVHALNAELPATLGARLAKVWGVPLLVTTTGTDLNRGLMALDRRGAVLANLNAANCILTLTEAQRTSVKAIVPGARVERITQGILLERSDFDLRSAVNIPRQRPVALMLGGLRPVKGQLLALEAWDRDFGWHLVIAGDPVDPKFTLQIQEAAASRQHVTILSSLPHGDAIAALASADALLNTSDSEGESRAILEAMALGTPVVARRIPGNAALIEDGVTGLLFDGAGDIESCLKRVPPGAPLAEALRAAAQRLVTRRADQEHDQDALARVYRQLIDEAPAAKGETEGPPTAAASPR